MSLDAHIVSHTHWDREWYHPVERFQQHLVALVDELLDDPPRSNESFLLDGQAIVVEDYLAIRPERAPEIAALLRDGRLEAGPWYVLADELIPSGEATVRNLLAGRRTLARLGAAAPNVLYCPDSFGHPAALPSLAAGFGLPVIVLWRGYGGPHWPRGDTVRWIAPNGDAALLFHLPRDGYEAGSHLPTNASDALERWQQLHGELAPRAVTGVTLVPNGADHHARQSRYREAIVALEHAAHASGDHAHPSSLRTFATSLIDRAAQHALPHVRGELRDSYGYTWTLQGTFGTRAHEKRLNAQVERLLERHAEPWSALAAFAARSGASRLSRRPLVDAAWRTLLSAHPHDTLCGCSIDDVAQAMELRLRSAANQARGIRDDAVADLIGHDAAAAHDAHDRWTPVVVLRNPACRVRSGVAIVDIEEFAVDAPVGPGSAARMKPVPPRARRAPCVPALGAMQTLNRWRDYSLIESPRHYPDNDVVDFTRAAAWVSDIPGYGVVCHPLGGTSRVKSQAVERVTVQGTSMRNGALSVTVSPDGIVSLERADSGRRIESLISLLDDVDVGDLYTPAPRPRPCVAECIRVRVIHRGPLRGEILLRWRVRAGPGPGNSTATKIADLDISLVLDASAPFLRLNVQGRNVATNHRLRLAISTGVRHGETWADAAFGPVHRQPVTAATEDSCAETPPPTASLHRYVTRFGESAGATIFGDGLAEYEARNDGSIIVTLIRAVGELSRNDIAERPGHAGWPRHTPAAQCLGPFAGRFAVMMHDARQLSTIDSIERAADDVLNPIQGSTLRSALGLPRPFDGIALSGAGLATSAIKESEVDDWLVLRCVNLSEEAVCGSWTLPFDVSEARPARLDETIMSELATLTLSARTVSFIASPREIVTILVR